MEGIFNAIADARRDMLARQDKFTAQILQDNGRWYQKLMVRIFGVKAWRWFGVYVIEMPFDTSNVRLTVHINGDDHTCDFEYSIEVIDKPDLESQLKDALSKEDYESAAKIRDEMKRTF